jgi:PmbA protein
VDLHQIAGYALGRLRAKGSDKAQCDLVLSEKHELNVNHDTISLLRTTYDTDLNLSVIKDAKKGSIRLNKTDKNSIDRVIQELFAIADSSKPDDAFDISEQQDAKTFQSGDERPDLDTMHKRFSGFLSEVKKRYPKLIIEESILDFTHLRRVFVNSNGVDFSSSRGIYDFWAMFTAKDEKKTSSFNYTGFSLRALEKELLEYGTLDTILRQTSEQLSLSSIPGKFVGEVLITPDCLEDFIRTFVGTFLSDHALISGTSIFKDSLNQTIADQKYTLHSRPVSEDLAGGYFITSDGFEAEDNTILEKGRLVSFNLSLFAANKTGKERSVNNGGFYVIEPGDTGYQDCIKKIKKGIMLCRFSGGSPNNNGDFSGVAKNSYYIEDGKIQYPVIETMISANLVEMFKNIVAVSAERINFGNALLPWMLVSGITISGK